jgi:hypothetical protein
LPKEQSERLKVLIEEYSEVFSDVPTCTSLLTHDVELVADAAPIKQHPYRVSPMKKEVLAKEVQYLLENDLIEPSQSEWSSPCLLVPKPDGSWRMCTDYRKVNAVTKTDSFPIPRVEDCIDRTGNAQYITKFDLLKGFWQVPLTDRAKEISAFVTPDGLFQYKRLPFGMKNSPMSFQRLIQKVIAGMEGVSAYIDDVVLCSNNFEEHVCLIKEFLERLSAAGLTVNLVKSDFCKATVVYLGYVVGQGKVRTVDSKVQAITAYPVPKSKKELMRFLGMAGYYRKYCPNFSTVAKPLTDLLKAGVPFVWSEVCEIAFRQLKAFLSCSPVLKAPDFEKEFKLAVDASDVGVGGVLLQEDDEGISHPVCYFSKKLSPCQRNYSTVEKECLALVLALQQFEVYVPACSKSVVVYTDHNPLVFLHKMRNKNQRLLRWSLILQEYNLDIRHIPGKDNVIGDALSRV